MDRPWKKPTRAAPRGRGVGGGWESDYLFVCSLLWLASKWGWWWPVTTLKITRSLACLCVCCECVDSRACVCMRHMHLAHTWCMYFFRIFFFLRFFCVFSLLAVRSVSFTCFFVSCVPFFFVYCEERRGKRGLKMTMEIEMKMKSARCVFTCWMGAWETGISKFLPRRRVFCFSLDRCVCFLGCLKYEWMYVCGCFFLFFLLRKRGRGRNGWRHIIKCSFFVLLYLFVIV